MTIKLQPITAVLCVSLGFACSGNAVGRETNPIPSYRLDFVDLVSINHEYKLALKVGNPGDTAVDVEFSSLLRKAESLRMVSTDGRKQWYNFSPTPVAKKEPSSMMRIQPGDSMVFLCTLPASELLGQRNISENVRFTSEKLHVQPKAVFRITRVNGGEISVKRISDK